MTQFSLSSWLSDNRQYLEPILTGLLPTAPNTPQTLSHAIHYATLSGGKRLRAMLCLATSEMCQGDKKQAAIMASAIEMVHAYSLVHDDLPCMDDDTLRRGQPTCHVKYGEAVALLVGDALLTQAFSIISTKLKEVDPAIRCELTGLLAASAGASGMVGGQYLDIMATAKTLDLTALQELHRGKTGALIKASILSGALIAKANATILHQLDLMADALGLLYQVVDDILDVEASTEILGKTAGKDALQEKSTYVTLLGLAEAKNQQNALCEKALSFIEPYRPQSEALYQLIIQISARDS